MTNEANGAGATLTIAEGEKYTTAMMSPKHDNARQALGYNLSGHCTNNHYRGLIIRNGKKFIRK